MSSVNIPPDLYRQRPPWDHFKDLIVEKQPDFYDKIQLGEFVSSWDAQLAYKIWRLPDDALEKSRKSRRSRLFTVRPNEELGYLLVKNVYEHLITDPLLPTLFNDGTKRKEAAALREKKWNIGHLLREPMKEFVRNGPFSNASAWKNSELKKHLKKRGISAENQDNLPKSLITDDLESHLGIMPLSDLSLWGIERPMKHMLQPIKSSQLSALDIYTLAIKLNPYNPTYWISRAYCHYQQAYFDLAIGDAYRAGNLCEVIRNSGKRHAQKGLYPRVWHAIEQHIILEHGREDRPDREDIEDRLRSQDIGHFLGNIQKTVYLLISLCLSAMGGVADLKRYQESSPMAFLTIHDKTVLSKGKEFASHDRTAYSKSRHEGGFFWHEKHKGSVSAAQDYPYQTKDVDRTQKAFLKHLNDSIFRIPHKSMTEPEMSKVRGKVRGKVRVKHSPNIGFGVYATSDIESGKPIHCEEPTIRGHLPPYRMKKDKLGALEELRCENCREIIPESGRKKQLKPDTCLCFRGRSQPYSRDGLMFCKPNSKSKSKKASSCLQIAKQVHHFGTCGGDWTWLYDKMRPKSAKWHDAEHLYKSADTNATYLSLLLRNVFEITLHRRKLSPTLCAHEIDELLMLEGDGDTWERSRFPFSLHANVILPFLTLGALGVDIFRDFSFDTWVIQIVLRKLLVNAVPWEKRRRMAALDIHTEDISKELESPSDQDRRIERKGSFKDWDPPLMNLYLFPGLSMFNHACSGGHNAEWSYDTEVPNRIIVSATKKIKIGEEIRLRHRDHRFRSKNRAIRLLGRPCQCSRCEGEHSDSDGSSIDTDSEMSFDEFSQESLLGIQTEGSNGGESMDSIEECMYLRHPVTGELRERIREAVNTTYTPVSSDRKRRLFGGDSPEGETKEERNARYSSIRREKLLKYREHQKEVIAGLGFEASRRGGEES